MYKIVRKKALNPTVTLMDIEAPAVAKKAEPGQFIILRTDENGERIPLTVADFDREKGTVTIIFQIVGATTEKLNHMNEGECLHDFAGPLGKASEFDHLKGKKAAVVAGGLGVPIAYPQAKALNAIGADVDAFIGFRSTSLYILTEEFKNACKNLYIMTDDGSNGHKGFVTSALEEQLKAGTRYDEVFVLGPMPMMRAVCNLTREYGIKTTVSMNTIMIDGTGMCGGCRLTVNGETKFACVDGPDFDGHLVDFDEAIMRSRMYKAEEKLSDEKHFCHLTGGER